MKKYIFYVLTGKLRRTYLKLIHINDTPNKIALGFAAGVFIGTFPTLGLGIPVVMGLCYFFRLNYAGGILGALVVMNPVSTAFIWTLCAWVGSLIFASETRIIIEAIKNRDIFNRLGDITVIFLTGTFVVSVFFAIVSYFTVKRIAEAQKLKRLRKKSRILVPKYKTETITKENNSRDD